MQYKEIFLFDKFKKYVLYVYIFKTNFMRTAPQKSYLRKFHQKILCCEQF